MAKANRKSIDVTLTFLGGVVVAVFIISGLLGLYAWHFATTQVHDQLSAQKVFFPSEGSPALDSEQFPGLQKYAGQQVDTGPEAKAYANEFIGAHLKEVAGGKSYAEVSALAMKDPANEQLQKQKQTLFQGETLRGLLLSAGYAYWTFGMIALYASFVFFGGAAIILILVLLGLRRIKFSR
jgi:hypothetical protein